VYVACGSGLAEPASASVATMATPIATNLVVPPLLTGCTLVAA